MRAAKGMLLRRAALVLVLGHLVFCAIRVPRADYQKRLEEIAKWRRRGDTGFHLGDGHMSGATLVEWIRDQTPENSVVLYEGEEKGALEFVPPLLWPRLLCRVAVVGDKAHAAGGRPVARGRAPDGRKGRFVLIGRGKSIELGVR